MPNLLYYSTRAHEILTAKPKGGKGGGGGDTTDINTTGIQTWLTDHVVSLIFMFIAICVMFLAKKGKFDKPASMIAVLLMGAFIFFAGTDLSGFVKGLKDIIFS